MKNNFSIKTCSFVVLSVSIFVFLFNSFNDASSQENLRETPIVKAVQKVKPAVVNISTKFKTYQKVNPFRNPFFDFFGDSFSTPFYTERESTSLGSGVIITKDGYILTNAHVVMNATKILVTLEDKREFEGKIEGGDPDFDVAIVKIDSKEELPTVEIGTSKNLLIGEPVLAIGNPFAYSHTVTTGIISALDRSINVGDKGSKKILNHLIQTDAAINPGNSGGPLLNIYGQLIGINTAIQGNAEGINFAIPIDRAVRIVKELLKYGEVEPPWVGFFIQEITSELAYHQGLPSSLLGKVIITDILPDSPAEKANLKRGDIITDIDDKKVASGDEYFDLINDHSPGDLINIKFNRNNKDYNVKLLTTRLPLEIAPKLAKDWLGFEVVENSQKLQKQLGLAISFGVVIKNVIKGKPAYNNDLVPGVIIIKVDSKDIRNYKDFEKSFVASCIKNKIYFEIFYGDRAYSLFLP
ncbi:trypsin-like peptidase domain-containing protein [bacterium]|nr:trypsin-like peptidase domain-containing protein [bacterium]